MRKHNGKFSRIIALVMAFSRLDSLKAVELPDSLKSLGQSVFYSCTAFERVSIGDGLEVISYQAFSILTDLAEISTASASIISPTALMIDRKIEKEQANCSFS